MTTLLRSSAPSGCGLRLPRDNCSYRLDGLSTKFQEPAESVADVIHQNSGKIALCFAKYGDGHLHNMESGTIWGHGFRFKGWRTSFGHPIALAEFHSPSVHVPAMMDTGPQHVCRRSYGHLQNDHEHTRLGRAAQNSATVHVKYRTTGKKHCRIPMQSNTTLCRGVT